MKVNITLRLNATLLRDIRALAEKEGASVSAFLTAHMEQIVGQRKMYEPARERALARLREGLICDGRLHARAMSCMNGDLAG